MFTSASYELKKNGTIRSFICLHQHLMSL